MQTTYSQSIYNTVDDIEVLREFTKLDYKNRAKLFYHLTKEYSESNYLCSNVNLLKWLSEDLYAIIDRIKPENSQRLVSDYYYLKANYDLDFFAASYEYNFDTLSFDPLDETYSEEPIEEIHYENEKVLLKYYFNQNISRRILIFQNIVNNFAFSAPFLLLLKEDLDSLLKVKTEDFIIESKWLKQGAFSSEIFNQNILIWKSKLKWK